MSEHNQESKALWPIRGGSFTIGSATRQPLTFNNAFIFLPRDKLCVYTRVLVPFNQITQKLFPKGNKIKTPHCLQMWPQKPQVCTSCSLNSCALQNFIKYCSVIYRYRKGREISCSALCNGIPENKLKKENALVLRKVTFFSLDRIPG